MFSLDDPRQVGLLSLGLRLMSTPGPFGQAFGQSGMGALYDAQMTRGAKQERELREMQRQQMQMALEAAKRQQEGDAKTQAYMQEAIAGPDATMAESLPGPRREPQGFDVQRALAAGVPYPVALQMAAQFRKEGPKLEKLGQGDKAGYFKDGEWVTVADNPKAPEQSSLAKLVEEMNALPPGSPLRAVYQNAIDKATTHQPGVSVSYGQPVAGVDAQGNSVFFQPAKGGGAPAIVPNVKPAPQNRDTKLPAELQRMQIAGDAMATLLDDYEKALKNFDPRSPKDQTNPTKRADIQSLKRNIELQLKELQALGALAGPDVQIIRESLSDPTTGAGAYYGSEGIAAQIRRTRDLIKARSDAVIKSQGQAPKAGRQVKRTGTANGRKVVEYSDGSIEYAD